MRLWIAQAISAFGSRITRTALPIIAVATLGESESVVALLASVSLAPAAVLALFAGGFVDRGNKRRILVVADVIRALAIISLTIAWACGVLSIVHVCLVGAVVGAASALFQIADVAYLPALVERGELVEGNSKLQTTEAFAEISGPASAGVLIAALGAPLAVVIDAFSYVWSAVMLGRIQKLEPNVGSRDRRDELVREHVADDQGFAGRHARRVRQLARADRSRSLDHLERVLRLLRGAVHAVLPAHARTCRRARSA